MKNGKWGGDVRGEYIPGRRRQRPLRRREGAFFGLVVERLSGVPGAVDGIVEVGAAPLDGSGESILLDD